MNITQEQYEAARVARDEAVRLINAFYAQEMEAFEQRLKDNPIFTDDELRYSAINLCPCGHGLAYPVKCGVNHYWDCSAILKGIADKNVEHTGRLPFAFYDVKSELQPSANGATTRGVFRPKPKE